MSFFSGLINFFTPSIDKGGVEESLQNSPFIRTHVRNMLVKNPSFQAYARMMRRGVFGTSFSIQSLAKDEVFQERFEYLISQWSKRKNCETTGMFFLSEALRSISVEYAGIGGCIIVHSFSKKHKYGYKFSIVTVDSIATEKHIPMNMLYNGIQLNEEGEIRSIWLYNGYNQTIPVEVKAKDFTLIVNKWVSPNQYSALSPFASILELLEHLDDYKQAEIRSAKKIADNPIFIKTKYFTDALTAKLQGLRADSKLSQKTEAEILTQSFRRREITDDSSKRFSYISDDEDIETVDVKRESVMETIWESSMNLAAAAMGVSSANLYNQKTASYNDGLRMYKNDSEEFQLIFEEVTEGFLREVIEEKLLLGLFLSGHLKFQDWDYIGNEEKYKPIQFMKRRFTHIDPIKEENARSEGFANGTRNEIDELSSQGIDWRQHLKNIEMYQKARKDIIIEKEKND